MTEPLTDHDKIGRIYDVIFEPDTGLKDRLIRQDLILLGDGTKENPGQVNVLAAHIDGQEKSDKQRNRRVNLMIGIACVIVLLIDRVLAFLGR